MLHKPSHIMMQNNVQTPKDFAFEIYKQLLVKFDSLKNNTGLRSHLFSSCFVDSRDAVLCRETIENRLKKSLEPSTFDHDYVFLPPLFIRSCKDEIAIIGQVVLVFCVNGPVVPIAFSTNNRTLHGDEELPTLIARLYQIGSSHFVDSDAIKLLL